MEWSPDGKYLIVGSGSPSFQLYVFNDVSETLTRIPTTLDSIASNPCAYSFNGQYLAVCLSGSIQIYSVSGTTFTSLGAGALTRRGLSRTTRPQRRIALAA